jgi:hypothetical protein
LWHGATVHPADRSVRDPPTVRGRGLTDALKPSFYEVG